MNRNLSSVNVFFRDPFVLAVLVLNLSVYLLYRFPLPDPDVHYFVTELLSLILLLGLGIFAPWIGLPPPESRAEKTFWGLWSGSFTVLMVIRVLFLGSEMADGVLDGSIIWDVLYGLFYLGLFLSLAGRPDQPASSARTRSLTALEFAGISILLLSILTYFVFISWSYQDSDYRTWLPSFLFYWVADVFLLCGFLYLRQTSTSPRWRIIFTWMVAIPFLWSITEVLEVLYYVGPEDVDWYPHASVNLLWYLPFALFPLVGRMRLHPFPVRFGRGAAPLVETELDPSLGRPGLLVTVSLILPMVHFGTNLLGFLDPNTRDLREMVVVVSTAGLLGLALFYQRLLEKSARDLALRSQELEEHRRWLAVAVEQSPDAVMIADGEGILRYANPASETYGVSAGELVGNHLREVLPQELAEDGRLEGALSEGIPWDGRLRSAGPENEAREEIISLSPSRNSAGEVFQWVVVRNDVTYLAKLERQLGQAQKMEALGTLAGGIAHDFNNILGAIYGYGEILSMDLDPESHSQEDLRGLLTAAERAAELVAQILTFSRQGEEEKVVLELDSEIREAVSLLRATLPSTITIREEIGGKEARVLGVRHQIHQMVLNLGTNAAHAMSEGGGALEIGLKLESLSQEEAHTWGLESGGGFGLLWVRDTGVGMDEDTIRRIFDPFFTTKVVGKGTGLGLSVVHGSVKGHGGAIRVESEPGKGTLFEILLPLSTEDEGRREPIKGPPPVGSGQTLLVVDDEVMLTDLARQILGGLGYEVVAFNSSQEALSHFLRDPKGYDALITDQTMPVLTGLELARKAKEVRADLPVLLSTGYSEVLSPERMEGAGVGRVLMKPYNRNDLGWAVAEVLKQRGSPGES